MKRLFVVFVIVMMLFVTGCQGVSIVNAKAIENGESIFLMSDENIINAGIVRGENGKYGGNDRDGEDGAGITNAAVNDSGDLLIQITHDTLTNADEVNGEDDRDGSDITEDTNDKDDKYGIDDKEAAPQPNKYAASGENNDVPIIMIQPQNETQNHGNHGYLVSHPASQEEYSYQEPTTDVPSNNEINPNANDDSSGTQPASQEEYSYQEPTTDVPSNNEIDTNANDYSSDTQHSPQEEYNSQEATTDVPSNNESSSNEPAFQIQIDHKSKTLISYEGTASHVELDDEDFYFIGDDAFKYNKNICSVTLPDSVTHIGKSAFEGCSQLTTLQLPPSVKSIGASAFKDTALSGSINLYATDISIGNNAYENTCIEKIVLDPSRKINLTVCPYAFANCSMLKSLEIANKESTLSLEDYSFNLVEHLRIYVGLTKNRLKIYPQQYSADKLGITGTISFLDPATLTNP